jgi:hypothetical protein
MAKIKLAHMWLIFKLMLRPQGLIYSFLTS